MTLRFGFSRRSASTLLKYAVGMLIVFMLRGDAAQAPSQIASPAAGVSLDDWLSKLSDALVEDVEAGDIETATLHHIQLQAAILMATDPQGAISEQSQKLREQLIRMTGTKSTGLIPRDAVATGPILSNAILIQAAVERKDWKAAKLYIGNLTLPLGQMVAAASESAAARANDPGDAPSKGSSQPDAKVLIGLLSKVQVALRTDDVLTAESYAPELLRTVQQWCDPVAQAGCYAEGFYAAYDALGRGAFLRGDFDGAKEYFLISATTPRGSVLEVAGPSLKLAEALLSKGYSTEVVQFLERSKSFWNSPMPDKWIAVIRNGKRPNFKDQTYY